MYTRPESVRPFIQVTSLSPTYRHRWRRRPMIANRFSCCPRLRGFTASYPSAVHGYSSLAGPSCPVFLCIRAQACVCPSHAPRVATAGSLMDTDTTRDTHRPPVRTRLLPERCAQCSLSCFRSALWERRLGTPGRRARPSFDSLAHAAGTVPRFPPCTRCNTLATH